MEREDRQGTADIIESAGGDLTSEKFPRLLFFDGNAPFAAVGSM